MSSEFVIGALAGVPSCVIGQPLDTLKTRVQSTKTSNYGAFKSLLQEGGPLRLWWGLGPSLYRGVLGPGVYFLALECLTGKSAASREREASMKRNVLDGALARTVSGALLSPLNLVKLKNELEGSSISTPRWLLTHYKQKKSLKALWTGVGPTLLRDAPYSGIYLAVYSKLNDSNNSFLQSMLVGLISGIAATTATQPFDSWKTHVQLKSVSTESRPKFNPFSGLVYRLARKPLSTATLWASYSFLHGLTTPPKEKET